MLTAKVAREYLDYDPETGIFKWKKSSNPNKISPGDLAGTRRNDGYRGIFLFNKQYLQELIT